MRKLRIYRSWSRAERREFWSAWRWLAAASASLRLFGVRRTLERFSVPVAGARPADADVRIARRVAWLELGARNSLAGGRCLERSLALLAQLQRDGIACELRIGVRGGSPGIEAHAWVEVDGRPVNDGPQVKENYARFAGLAAARRHP